MKMRSKRKRDKPVVWESRWVRRLMRATYTERVTGADEGMITNALTLHSMFVHISRLSCQINLLPSSDFSVCSGKKNNDSNVNACRIPWKNIHPTGFDFVLKYRCIILLFFWLEYRCFVLLFFISS